MIRFIDLGKQIGLDEEWPREFAFYNTAVDKFIDICGTQTWENWAEFEADWLLSARPYTLERFMNLCPDWVFGHSAPPEAPAAPKEK